MKVYPIPTQELSLPANDVVEAAGVAVPDQGGYPPSGSGCRGGGLTVSSSRSVTKDGTVRLLFEVAMAAVLPSDSYVPDAADTRVTNLKVHTVVTVPKLAVNVAHREASDPTLNGQHSVVSNLGYMLAVLTALTTNRSIDIMPSNENTEPVSRGILGARPLDTYQGSYGIES